jgi:O-methyltransferase involved in polyketide biosynthesis
LVDDCSQKGPRKIVQVFTGNEPCPKGTIVNLGAGLETAFYRVDNQKLTWIDLDLPEVISLRDKLLSNNDRIHQIAKSVLDYSWMDDVKKHSDECFFFAGGLFMYFTEEQIKALLLEMARRFPRSELIFDSISTKGIYYANKMLTQSKMTDALMQWGVDNTNILESWSQQIKIVSQIPYFKGMKTMKGFPFLIRLKMFIYDSMNKSGITHLKFC